MRGHSVELDHTDEFDRALEWVRRHGLAPFGVDTSFIATHEALRVAWGSVQAVFGERATSADAVAVAGLMLAEARAFQAHAHAMGDNA